MKKQLISPALLICLLLLFAGCGAKQSTYNQTDRIFEAAQSSSCYAEAGGRIPKLESVLADAVQSEETGTDENGSYHRYIYTWNDPDVHTLSDRFSSWLEMLDETADMQAEPYLNGTYYIVVDGERVGLASSSRTDEEACICIQLYTDVES